MRCVNSAWAWIWAPRTICLSSFFPIQASALIRALYAVQMRTAPRERIYYHFKQNKHINSNSERFSLQCRSGSPLLHPAPGLPTCSTNGKVHLHRTGGGVTDRSHVLAGPLATEHGRQQRTSPRDFISCSSGPQDLISDHQPLSVCGLPSVLFGCSVRKKALLSSRGFLWPNKHQGERVIKREKCWWVSTAPCCTRMPCAALDLTLCNGQ